MTKYEILQKVSLKNTPGVTDFPRYVILLASHRKVEIKLFPKPALHADFHSLHADLHRPALHADLHRPARMIFLANQQHTDQRGAQVQTVAADVLG